MPANSGSSSMTSTRAASRAVSGRGRRRTAGRSASASVSARRCIGAATGWRCRWPVRSSARLSTLPQAAAACGTLCGNVSVKVLPWPGMLCTAIAPPSRLRRSREIDRPRPVPPYRRLVVPSAWRKASKMTSCWSGGMPMPVSLHRESERRRASPGDTVSVTLAAVGELDGVGQQVLQDLFDALAVGDDASVRCVGGDVDPESESLLSGQRLEGHLQRFDQPSQRHLFWRQIELAGLDLRDVEDVVDQGQQVVAGRIDGLRELDLFLASGCLPCCRPAAWRGSASC